MSFENKVVIGGTPTPTSNRMWEDASQLEKVDKDLTQRWEENIASVRTRLELVRILLIMSDYDHHIVGSRGFVYNSKHMAREVANFHPLCSNVLTRGLGLRERCTELYKIEKLEENLLNKLKEEFDIGKSE